VRIETFWVLRKVSAIYAGLTKIIRENYKFFCCLGGPMICFRKVDKRDSTEKKKLNCFERSALKILKRVVSVWFGNTEMRLETLVVMTKKMRLTNFGVESVSQLCKCT